MSDTIGNIGSNANNASVRTMSVVAEAQKQESTSAAARSQIQPISPTMKQDPIAGVMVTQFLDSNGEVQAQLPSAAAIAYLRVGLTVTGEQPKKDHHVVQETSKNLLA